MKNYVYIIPFLTEEYYKIGKTNDLNRRSGELFDLGYPISLDDAWLCISENEHPINIIERALLYSTKFEENLPENKYHCKGYREVRNYKSFDLCLMYAKDLCSMLNVNLIFYPEYELKERERYWDTGKTDLYKTAKIVP